CPGNNNNGNDSALITISGAPTLSSGGAQVYTVGDPSTVTFDLQIKSSPGSPSKILAANGIDLIIPAGLHMEWDQTIRRGNQGLVFTGAGSAHVDLTPTTNVFSYTSAKIAHLSLTGDFGSNETLNIHGLKFTNFTQGSPAGRLTLDTVKASVTDAFTIAIGEPTITSQVAVPGQIFSVNGNPAVTAAAANILVRDDAQIPAVNRITVGGKIRIRIPTSPAPASNLVWSNGVGTVTCTGNAVAGGFMAATAGVSYEDGDK